MPEHTDLADLDGSPHAEVFETPRPRTVRLELAEGARVPPHSHAGTDVVVHLVSGRLEFSVDDEVYELRPDDLLRFRGSREVSPHALEDSTAVIVFAPADPDDRP